MIQKFCGNQLRSKKYIVNFEEIYHASPHIVHNDQNSEKEQQGTPLLRLPAETSSDEAPTMDLSYEPTVRPERSSSRIRRPPDWLATEEIERR